jgi:hypothetical protein
MFAFVCLIPLNAKVEGPLAAHVEVTPLKTYGGGKSLPKPEKILVYDFAFDPKEVQVDKTQEFRPRHVIAGDEKPTHIGEDAAKKLSRELINELAKTGVPVERASADTTPPDNALIVKGNFLSIKQGVKTERVVVGMGTGSAEVNAHVQVQFKAPQETVLVSEFETHTTLAKNLGAGVPIAAGLNPAVAAGRSTVSDRKKTVDAYASKTADAAAKQITDAMAGLGWIKVDGNGKVVK